MTKIRSYDEIVKEALQKKEDGNDQAAKIAQSKKQALILIRNKRDAADLKLDEAVSNFENAILSKLKNTPALQIDEAALALQAAEASFKFYNELYWSLFGKE